MTTLTLLTDLALSGIGAAATAMLSVLGALLVFVVAAWGGLHIYCRVTGEGSAGVAQRMGRMFGRLVYEAEYRDWEARFDKKNDRTQGRLRKKLREEQFRADLRARAARGE